MAIVDEIARALGSEIDLTRDDDGTLIVTDRASSRQWLLLASEETLEAHVRSLDASGRAVGVGGPSGSGAASPGVALLTIHMEEAVATAAPGSLRLVIHDNGVQAE